MPDNEMTAACAALFERLTTRCDGDTIGLVQYGLIIGKVASAHKMDAGALREEFRVRHGEDFTITLNDNPSPKF